MQLQTTVPEPCDIRNSENEVGLPGYPLVINNYASLSIPRSPQPRQVSMAEAVGLAASIIAIAGLAETVLKFVGETRHIVKDMRNLSEEMRRSMDRIHFAAGTIDTAQTTLSEYSTASPTATQLHVIQFIDHNDTTSFLKSESEYLGLHVNKLRQWIHALRNQRWLRLPVATMLWRYFIKEQIQDLRDDMQFIQINLTTLVGVVQLEVALKRPERHEAEMQVELFA